MVSGSVDSDLGRVLAGKYRLEEIVDVGSTGIVYRATHVSLGKTVIVKLLGSTFAGDPLRTTRFHREAKVASLVQHPNVVQILDFGEEEDGALFLVMENLVGTTLDVLMDTGNVSFLRAMEIMRQVLSGVRAAHRHNIIHRDIKPGNVLVVETVNEEGEPQDLVKVLDFGIAKSMDPGAGGPSATMDLVSGTPQFMSPEQCQGHKLDARSDLYSCGCVLYFLLTGKAPFTADNPVAVIYKHVSEDAPAPSELSGSPADMDAIVARAMAKRPDDRFQNAQEMRTALSQVAGHFIPDQVQKGPSSRAPRGPAGGRSLTPSLAAASISKPPEPSRPPEAWKAGGSIPVSTADIPQARKESAPPSTPPPMSSAMTTPIAPEDPEGSAAASTAGLDQDSDRGKPVDGVVRGMVGGPALDTPLGWVPDPERPSPGTASSAFDAPVPMGGRKTSNNRQRWLFLAAILLLFMLIGACLGVIFGTPGSDKRVATGPAMDGTQERPAPEINPATPRPSEHDGTEAAVPEPTAPAPPVAPIMEPPSDSAHTEPAPTHAQTRTARPRFGSRNRGRRPNSFADRGSDWPSETSSAPTDPESPSDPEVSTGAPELPAPEETTETVEVLPPPPPETAREPPPAPEQPATPALTARTQLSGLGVVGPMATPTVQQSLASASGAFGSCYRTAAQRAGRDGYGRVNLSFRIDETGGARRVQVSGARLPGLNRCMAQVINRLSFRPRPVGLVNVTFNVSYLSPG